MRRLALTAVLVSLAASASAAPSTLTIPSAASIHGGAFFHSDLWLLSRAYSGSLPVTATYRCFTGPCPTNAVRTFLVPARQARLFPDVVATLFGAPETAGAIELSWDDAAGQLSALSRVYSGVLPEPTYGTAIPALSAIDVSTRSLFLGLGNAGGQPGGFRSNGGAYNPGAAAVTVTFQLQDASGAKVGNPVDLHLAPTSAGQVNDLFKAAGSPSAAGTNFELIATATAPVFFNVNVIDNGSGDSVFALPSADVPKPAAAPSALAASPTTVTVPASASIHGAAGTFFHTDLWATNRSFGGPITVTAHLRCATGHCTDTVKTFDLAARETKLFEDVVGSFFFSPESSAAIELTWDSSAGDLFATTRTYTPELPAPTSGTTIPAQDVNDVKIRALFLGVAGNGGDTTTGFRTNAGAYNAFPIATTVTFSLYDAEGRLLGQKTYPWAANQAWQVNDVFATLGAGATTARDAYLVASSPLPLFFYVTVIDDRSGDSFYVPASNDEAAP